MTIVMEYFSLDVICCVDQNISEAGAFFVFIKKNIDLSLWDLLYKIIPSLLLYVNGGFEPLYIGAVSWT
jgi:hypothetical protein